MNFASKSVIHENSLGSFTCRKAGTWDILFYFPSEGRHTEDFPDARKIQRLRPGLNPRTRVPVASMLTTRPPKLSSAWNKSSPTGRIFMKCGILSVFFFRKSVAIIRVSLKSDKNNEHFTLRPERNASQKMSRDLLVDQYVLIMISY